MSRKSKWARFKEYYNNRNIKSDIYNMPLDQQAYDKYESQESQEQYVSEIYKKYNIKRFSSKKDFTNSINKEESTLWLTPTEINNRWKYYEKRDKLIRSHQYDMIRLDNYREQYIKMLEQLNISQSYIDTIRNMSYDKWSELISEPNTDKDSPYTKKLPIMGEFDYHVHGVFNNEKKEDYEQRIMDAFNSVGVSLYNDDLMDNINVELEEQRVEPLNSEAFYSSLADYERFERNVVRILPRKYKYDIISNLSSNEKYKTEIYVFETMYNQEKLGKKLTRVVNGNFIINFVGSTKGKNSEFARRYKEYKDNKQRFEQILEDNRKYGK